MINKYLTGLVLIACVLASTSCTHKQSSCSIAKAPAHKAVPAEDISFKKIVLSTEFYSEGATIGDFNKDGKMDVVSGPYWYEGPDFKTKHEYYPAKPFDVKEYSHAFFAFVEDFNHDGWDDIMIVAFPGEDASWYENPQGKDGPWKKHLILASVDDESPEYKDLTGDGQRKLVCITQGQWGYASPDKDHPDQPWTFHPISAKGSWQRFTHGLGVGDVNGDGRKDVMEATGWWEQPASLAGDPEWKHHDFTFGPGGAQMHALDINGDGKPDIITSIAAHRYGLAWFEQTADGGFTKHTILGETPAENPQGVCFSEMHAVAVADMNDDGLMDIVTGKRWYAHGATGDPDADKRAVLYWFEQHKTADGKVEFIPHMIDDDSGVGTQVVVADVNGDHVPDVIVGNKKGTFVFIQQRK